MSGMPLSWMRSRIEYFGSLVLERSHTLALFGGQGKNA